LDIANATLTLTNTADALTVNGMLSITGTGALSSPASADLVFNGTYIHSRNGGSIPTANWNPGSLCNITGIVNTTLVSGLNPTSGFYDFIWNCSGQTAAINLGGKLTTIANNFTISTTNGQQLQLSTTVKPATAISIGNNFQVDGNSRLALTTTAVGVTVNVGGDLNFNATNASGSPLKTTGSYTLNVMAILP